MGLRKGLVIKSFGAYFNVYSEGVVYQTTIKGSLRLQSINTKHPIAVGDNVLFDINPKEDKKLPCGVIHAIQPRNNRLGRAFLKSGSIAEHTLAANVDYIFSINSIINPDFKSGFLDRILVAAGLEKIPVVIVLNKADLVGDDLQVIIGEEISEYKKLGYNVQVISALDTESLTGLKQLICQNVILFVGQSGVGKSTLLNSLYGKNLQTTREVNDYNGKGKHTTTNPELVLFPQGGWVIDTPGVKEFGIYWIDKLDISYYYREMSDLISDCKFGNNCTHDHEPHCAVKMAVEQGKVNVFRYENYINMIHNLN